MAVGPVWEPVWQESGLPGATALRRAGFLSGRQSVQVLTQFGASALLNVKKTYLATLRLALCQNLTVPGAPNFLSSWLQISGGGYTPPLLGTFGVPVTVPGPFVQITPAVAVFTPSGIVTPAQTIGSYVLYDPATSPTFNVVAYELLTSSPLPQWAPSGIPVVLQYLMQESQYNPTGYIS